MGQRPVIDKGRFPAWYWELTADEREVLRDEYQEYIAIVRHPGFDQRPGWWKRMYRSGLIEMTFGSFLHLRSEHGADEAG